jgi:signal transduction histidine kinase
VAYQWRIRHKLMLGLGLVVGIIALLLAGTLKGLVAYSLTMKSIDSKVQEEAKVENLREAIGLLAVTDGKTTLNDEPQQLRAKMGVVQERLAAYEAQLQDTLHRRRDPDKGFTEKGIIDELHKFLGLLDKALGDDIINSVSHDPTIHLVEMGGFKENIQKLTDTADDLHRVIYDSIHTRIHEAKGYYRDSLIIVISTSVFGVLLMSGVLRFFYRWVFYPIRDLEQGAGRVAQGDFEHRIDVHSGDEMEDLAAAFNNMTSRLQEMYRDLEHQVNERSRQLVRSERLASVGFLAAGVAHEINNPLASIAFCSEALEARLTEFWAKGVRSQESGIRGQESGVREKRAAAVSLTTDPSPLTPDHEVITKYLKMIQEEAFRCKAITERLLEFSRSSERRRERVDLAELIQSVLDMVQHLQNYKSKQIVFEPAGPLYAWINAQEIKSVVLNLVVNALDSMDEDGQLHVLLGQRDRMAEMRFSDTGCGMSQEILDNIFEPFFTRSRTGKGTGLGLAISHRVITQHGGEIEATSPGLNQGSTFTVRLPMQPAESVKEETLVNAAA